MPHPNERAAESEPSFSEGETALHPPSRERGRAVVSLDRGHVEWCELLEEGAARRGTAEVLAPGAVGLAEAVVRAHELAGGRTRRCVLALGPTLAPLARVALPPMRGGDLTLVLTRRARALLGAGAVDPRFHAQRLERGGDRDPDDAGEAWLVTAFDARHLRSLVAELARRGFRCRGVASRLLAGFVHGRRRLLDALAEPVEVDLTGFDEQAPDPTAQLDEAEGERRALMTLLVEAHGVTIGLQEGESLLHVEPIPGDLLRDAGCAASVLQEVRALASFFRRESRGGKVDAAIVVGLEDDALASLSVALQRALPQAEVLAASRAAWLAEAAVPGRRHPELLPRRSSRTRVAIAAAAALALAGVGVSWRVRADGLDELASTRVELERFEARASELGNARRKARSIERSFGHVEQRLERLASLSLRDVDLEGTARGLAGALDPDAVVDAFALTSTADGRVEVAVDTRTRSAALGAYEAVAAVRTRLTALAGAGPTLALPARLDGTGEARPGLAVRLALTLDRLDPTLRAPEGAQ